MDSCSHLPVSCRAKSDTLELSPVSPGIGALFFFSRMDTSADRGARPQKSSCGKSASPEKSPSSESSDLEFFSSSTCFSNVFFSGKITGMLFGTGRNFFVSCAFCMAALTIDSDSPPPVIRRTAFESSSSLSPSSIICNNLSSISCSRAAFSRWSLRTAFSAAVSPFRSEPAAYLSAFCPVSPSSPSVRPCALSPGTCSKSSCSPPVCIRIWSATCIPLKRSIVFCCLTTSSVTAPNSRVFQITSLPSSS